MRREIDNIEIKEPPIEELKKNNIVNIKQLPQKPASLQKLEAKRLVS